ncbi:unnamed protein product [Acanthoscelides obtectus]|uniref:Uncharacterized protein n=1 Tax=Acanthoscelides obtectus TaxID=200917 RepID=A0A9P0M8T8_ACAOB|nr:unnamed protein product [Acanthoscelides obtectus]CAK1652077.1 hypothetical protein AOBTE_LOCUS17664 [Acanthoscelides obtectus]
MIKVTHQGHSETQGLISRSLEKSRSHNEVTLKLKVTLQAHSETQGRISRSLGKTQGHTSRSLGNSR